MEHTVPETNWHVASADLIRDSTDGDTIIVRSEAMRELGEIAHKRMCPNKMITFKVVIPTWELS